jgi:hypothetical protein
MDAGSVSWFGSEYPLLLARFTLAAGAVPLLLAATVRWARKAAGSI